MIRQAGIIKMKLYNLSYFFREAVASIFKHRVMSLAASGVIMACLILMGSFGLVAANIERVLQDVESKNQVVVFVNESYTVDQAKAIAPKIEELPNVVNATYVSKADALEEFRKELGDDSNLLDGLGNDNPLRDRYVITLKDQALTKQTAEALSQVEGVASVQARSDISEKIIQVRSVVTAICLALIIMLLAVSIFIISNTVNLTIFNRREEIAIMKMIGAKNGFVRAPFVLEGLILGLVGAAFAFFIQWGLYEYLMGAALSKFQLFKMIGFADVWKELALVFAGVGVLVGGVGSGITMRKFLKV